jgi:hypothetical protein
MHLAGGVCSCDRRAKIAATLSSRGSLRLSVSDEQVTIFTSVDAVFDCARRPRAQLESDRAR